MIVGKGLIASVFEETYQEDHSYTIFASGVANSNEIDPDKFQREKRLLLEHINNENIFVYFSTCSVYDSFSKNSNYVQHKLEMEYLIQSRSSRYVIFRLPQVAGFSRNKNTLMNFLANRIVNEEKFELFDIERNIIDVNDVYSLVRHYLDLNINKSFNKIINIAYPVNIKVVSLVELMEIFYNKKAVYITKTIENYSFKVELEEYLRNGFFSLCLKDYILNILSQYYI